MIPRPVPGLRSIGLALVAALGLLPAAAWPADDRVLPSRAPVLLDGAGRVLGPVYAGFDRKVAVLWLRVAGRDLLLEATDDTLAPSAGHGNSRLGFESSDCSGPPWFMGPTSKPPLVFTEVAPGPDSTLWVDDGQPGVANITSTLHPTSGSPCQVESGGFLLLKPAVQILDLKSFLPPFTIR